MTGLLIGGVGGAGRPALAAPGQLDTSFGSSNLFNGVITAMSVQADGRVLVTGNFDLVDGQPRWGVVRLTEDGALDLTFDAGPGAPPVTRIQALADGKILVAGQFVNFNGYQRRSIARLLPNGKVDSSFATPIGGSGLAIVDFAVRGDGKVYICGEFTEYFGHPTAQVALLNTDGTVDASFTSSLTYGTVTRLALYPNAANPQSLLIGPGPYFFGTEFRQEIARVNAATGAFDPAFAVASPTVTIGGSSARILPLPDGRLLVPGLHDPTTASPHNGMLRLLADGTVDTAFQAGPIPSHFDPNVAAAFSTAESLSNGRIVASGNFATVQGLSRTNLVHLLANGAVDSAFHPNSLLVAPTCLATQPDGHILIAGAFQAVDGQNWKYLARLHGLGAAPVVLDQPDPLTVYEGESATLVLRAGGDPTPTVTWYRGVTPVGTGKTLTIASATGADQGQYHATLQNAHDSVDSATVTLTVIVAPPQITKQPVDTTVGMGATARFEVELVGSQPFGFQWFENGLILTDETNSILDIHVNHTNLYGYFYHAIVTTPRGVAVTDQARILPTLEGHPDKEFLLLAQTLKGGSWHQRFRFDFRQAKTLALQPDGHVIVGGGLMQLTLPAPIDLALWASLGLTQFSNHLTRLDAAGELALGELGSTYLDGPVNDLAVAPDGSFYAVGTFTKFGGTPRSRLIKFNANATLAAGFAVEILPTNALVRCVAVQADGRVLIGGTFTSVAGEPRKGVAQLLPNGALDTSFVPAIASLGLGGVLDVAARADGKVLVAGAGTFYESDDIFGRSRHQLVRLNANGSWDDDFDTYGGATGNPDDYFVKQVLVQPDQRILIAGSFTRFGGATNENLARLLPTGESDPDFNPRGECCGATYGGVNAIALSPGGSIYVAGQFPTPQSNNTEVVRLHANGRYDPSWFPAWRDATPLIDQPETVTALVVQTNEQPILAGNFVVPAHILSGGLGASKIYVNAQLEGAVETSSGGAGGGGGPVNNDFSPPQVHLLNVHLRCHLAGLVRLFDESVVAGNLVITVQPKGAVLNVTTNYGYLLNVTADTPGQIEPLTYQWMKNGVVLPGQTNNFHHFYPITLEQAGNYSVLVSAIGQNVFSQTAPIQVLPTGSLIGLPSLAGGGFQWQFPPSPGQSFSPEHLANLSLQKSSNLVNWVTVPGALVLDAGTLIATDPEAAMTPLSFYRLKLEAP